MTTTGFAGGCVFGTGYVAAGRLRMKIEDTPSDPQMLLTVRRIGYKWNVVG